MAKADAIRDLFRIPTRFMRSVQLERDFYDPGALENYIVTPAMADAFHRVVRGLQPNSGHRAWRITGDYGVGKSAFALVLAHLLSGQDPRASGAIGKELGLPAKRDGGSLWPILVTGSREPLACVVARGVAKSLRRRQFSGAGCRAGLALIERADGIAATGDTAALEHLVDDLRTQAEAAGCGVLLIIDELGKLLEYAAQDSERRDVFLLQKLAETASGSGARPFMFVGLLHQGFRAYAERLPSLVRNEWNKVAERFDEIVFDQPLAHTADLVAGALNLRIDKLPKAVTDAAGSTARATASMGWLGGETTAVRSLSAAQIYPLHPTLLPPLIRFFGRYGQNERSLFGFLLSSEPFGLQAFSERPATARSWYGLPEFYDYVRAVFGHRLSGPSAQSNWVRLSETVDSAADLSDLERRVLKAAAMLSLLDAEDLLATDHALEACMAPTAVARARGAISVLVERGLLFPRGGAGYRLWPNSSVNLRAALSSAEQALGELQALTPYLAPVLDREPILARRHYIETGTLRHFEVRYAAPDTVQTIVGQRTEADGLVVVVLADTPADVGIARAMLTKPELAKRDDLVLGVVGPLSKVAADIADLRAWTWVAVHTPELVDDVYASAEVRRQLAEIRRRLSSTLGLDAALRSRSASTLEWTWKGEPLPADDGLTSALSRICLARFHSAPLVKNEILNRRVLGAAASAARMRLIEGLMDRTDEPVFGIDARKAPPERSMYMAIFEKGRLHQPASGSWRLVSPQDDDPLNLRPALIEMDRMLDAAGLSRVSVRDILDQVARPPWGVRAGLSTLLLTLALKLRAHELAVYENGTFLPLFSSLDAMRLVKRPELFELQVCRVQGVRADVFVHLAEAFAKTSGREPELLDIVTALSRFTAQLPEYTRKAGSLTAETRAVRDVLLKAQEPATLLFQDLPLACGLEPFAEDAPADPAQAAEFVERLQTAVAELRSDYDRLLQRLTRTVASVVTPDAPSFDRIALAGRASRVALTASAPRLKTFAMRLRDPGTSDDAWIDALASFVIAKPTVRWIASDEARCMEELAGLSDLFHRVEAIAFRSGYARPNADALGVTLTRADGVDLFQVVESNGTALDEGMIREFETHLPGDRATRIQFLSRMLWSVLEDAPAKPEVEDIPSVLDRSQ